MSENLCDGKRGCVWGCERMSMMVVKSTVSERIKTSGRKWSCQCVIVFWEHKDSECGWAWQKGDRKRLCHWDIDRQVASDHQWDWKISK